MRSSDWQRVSPVASVYFLLKSLPQLVNLWPAVLGIWATGGELRPLLFSIGIPLVLGLVLIDSFFQYWFFRFRLEDKAIAVRSGFLKRTRLSLDFARVQQADISQPFYFKPFNLVTLALESAGSAQQEVDLPAIPAQQAETLRALFLQRRDLPAAQQQAPNEDAALIEATEQQPDYQLRLSPGEVARYGLMQNTLLFLAPLAAPLGQYVSGWVEHWTSVAAQSPILESTPLAGMSGETWLPIVLVIAAVVVCGLGLMGLSVGLALFHYWGYHFYRVGDYLQSRAGLITTRVSGFKHHKLQKITIAQGILARLLRRHSVFLSKAGSFSAEAEKHSNRFTIPVVNAAVLVDILKDLGVTKACWRKVSRFYIVWNSALYGLGLMLLTLALEIGPAQAALIALPAASFFFWCRWRKLSYFSGGDWIALRTGWIGYKEQWLPTGKVQKLAVREAPHLRIAGLADLYIWGTDGAVVIPCIPHKVAYELRDELLADVVAYKKAWL